MISSSVTIGLLKAIDDAGANPDETLRNLHIDPADLSRPEGFIACSSFARLMRSRPAIQHLDCASARGATEKHWRSRLCGVQFTDGQSRF
jgi:hypothetical protein